VCIDRLTGVDETLRHRLDANRAHEGNQSTDLADQRGRDRGNSLTETGSGEGQLVIDAVVDESTQDRSDHVTGHVYSERQRHGGRVGFEKTFQMNDSVAKEGRCQALHQVGNITQ